MSRLRKFYFAHLVGRIVLAIVALYLYLCRRDAFSVLRD